MASPAHVHVNTSYATAGYHNEGYFANPILGVVWWAARLERSISQKHSSRNNTGGGLHILLPAVGC